MAILHHTFQCPIVGFEQLQMVVDLGMTQAHYTERLQQDEYALLVDIPNWGDVLSGDKPAFPLTGATIMCLPFVLVRYVATSLLADALDDFMEARSPNLSRR